ncbi:MAG: hypothetical protein EOO43_02175 [Flavobacterium sp.]|nr:MAG: hypothetical protein EOO43_02175 [Flavobacterium sp.]
MAIVAKWTVVLFGLFLVYIAFLMLFAPVKARETLRKAGSTNFINYAEITLRMIPAIGMILCSEDSKYPELFKIFGGFMLATSLVLYLVPRKLHHAFSMRAADVLKPIYFRLLFPVTLAFGIAVIYCVI